MLPIVNQIKDKFEWLLISYEKNTCTIYFVFSNR